MTRACINCTAFVQTEDAFNGLPAKGECRLGPKTSPHWPPVYADEFCISGFQDKHEAQLFEDGLTVSETVRFEVGKAYHTRRGYYVTILRDDGSALPLQCDDGIWRQRNGNTTLVDPGFNLIPDAA